MAKVIYLQPLDSHTNRVFADFGLDEALVTEVQTSANAEPMKVWEASEAQYDALLRSKHDQHLDFNEFERKGRFVRRIPQKNLALY